MNNLVQFLLELSLLVLWESCSENDIAEASLFLAGKVLKRNAEQRFVVTIKVM